MNAHQVSANSKRLSISANGAGPDLEATSAWRRFCASTTAASLLTGGFFVLVVVTLARSFRLPNNYSKGHWLHNYKHGFIPRGLVGEIVYPIMQNKGPHEIDGIIAFLSWGVLSALVLGMVAVTWLVLSHERSLWRRVMWASLLAAFATSPFVVQTGHLAGYFDHIIQLLGVIALAFVCYRRFWLAGLSCAVAILTHEMFVVTVMPAVFFASLLFLQGQSWSQKFKGLTGLLLIPILVSLFTLAAGTQTNDWSALTRDIARYGVVEIPSMATVHASQGFRSIFDQMLPTTLQRMARPESIRAVMPCLVLMLVGGTVMPFGGRAIGLRIVFVLTSLTPLVMLLTVWDGDTGRMTAKTLFCAFCGLIALGQWAGAQGKPAPEAGRGMMAGVAGFAVAAIGLSVYQANQTLWLMDMEVDGEGMMSRRVVKAVPGYRCEQLVFENSNFEMGSMMNWRHSGAAFLYQPVDRQPGQWIRRPWNERQHWVGTFDRVSETGRPLIQGDGPIGTMSSIYFTITRPYLNFLVGGGDDIKRIYVALIVDGKEVYRTTGRSTFPMREVVWDLRPYYGHPAYIHVVDQSQAGWGHIAVDGFCYRSASPELPQRFAAQRQEAKHRQAMLGTGTGPFGQRTGP